MYQLYVYGVVPPVAFAVMTVEVPDTTDAGACIVAFSADVIFTVLVVVLLPFVFVAVSVMVLLPAVV